MNVAKAKKLSQTLGLLGLTLSVVPGLVLADSADVQNQIQSLQQQLNDLQGKVSSATASSASNGTVNVGPVNLTINGFIEAAGIYRNRDEVADMGSKWAPVYPNSDAYHINDFRFSSRQSRLSFLFQGPQLENAKAEAYYELDFLGVGTSSNSTESNSYVPRTRQIYLDYASNNGWQVMAGQAWSLATQNKTGIDLRKENAPMTIEAQYVPGFTWTRNPQFRLTDKVTDQVTAAISLESPQAIATGTKPSGTVSTLPGGSTLNATNNYTLDSRPDVIAKVAVDPGFGHYELIGMDRSFRDRVDPSGVVINGSNNTTTGHGLGANMILPLAPKMVDFQASIMEGNGIGRYGSAQLPDFTFRNDGSITTLKDKQLLLGLIGHATSDIDLYTYYGMESADSNYDTGAFGYGNPANSNAGCTTTSGTCTANTKDVKQWTVGMWYKFYRNPAGGYMTGGLQYSHTNYDVFADAAGNAPKTDMNVAMISLRYYPSQK